MVDLEDVTTDQLRNALDEVGGKRPTQRLTAAIAYKRGVDQTEIASWYGVERKTVYNWLRRFESESGSLADAARDETRRGRPRRLTGKQRAKLEEILQNPPKDAGYDAVDWTPELVQRTLDDRWSVEYSRRTCRRFLEEMGS